MSYHRGWRGRGCWNSQNPFYIPPPQINFGDTGGYGSFHRERSDWGEDKYQYGGRDHSDSRPTSPWWNSRPNNFAPQPPANYPVRPEHLPMRSPSPTAGNYPPTYFSNQVQDQTYEPPPPGTGHRIKFAPVLSTPLINHRRVEIRHPKPNTNANIANVPVPSPAMSVEMEIVEPAVGMNCPKVIAPARSPSIELITESISSDKAPASAAIAAVATPSKDIIVGPSPLPANTVTSKRQRTPSSSASEVSLIASNTSLSPPALPTNAEPVKVRTFGRSVAVPGGLTAAVAKRKHPPPQREPISFKINPACKDSTSADSRATSKNILKTKSFSRGHPNANTTATAVGQPTQTNYFQSGRTQCSVEFIRKLQELDRESTVISQLTPELMESVTSYGSDKVFSQSVVATIIAYALGEEGGFRLSKTVDWNKRFRVLWVVTEIFKLDRIHLVNTLRNELLAANTLVYLFGRLIKRINSESSLKDATNIIKVWETCLPGEIISRVKRHLEKQRNFGSVQARKNSAYVLRELSKTVGPALFKHNPRRPQQSGRWKAFSKN